MKSMWWFASATMLAACASGASSSGTNACSVLRSGEVAAAMNEPVSNVVRISPDRCRYFGRNPADFITVRASESGARTLFAGTGLGAGLLRLPHAQSAGIGDESYWADRTLWVRKGDAFVAIDMGTAAVDQVAAGTKLARIAVSRL